MATHVERPVLSSAVPYASESSIPWSLWLMVAACSSAVVGAHWDISWHSSIGRDDFWTPAHMAIYLCGVFGGLSAGYSILSNTFGKADAQRQAVVSIYGFKGPLGAFLVGWGGLAMLTSAPFDDWWHSAYGLDVKILSPPHVLLLFGFFTVQMGSLVLTMSEINRASGARKASLQRVFLYLGGLVVVTLSISILELSTRTLMHSAFFYRAVALTLPLPLAMIGRASGHRWGASIGAGVYTLVLLAFQWILPLFPAEAKLGPVYNPVTYFVPPQFPLLILAPALCMDYLMARLRGKSETVLALSCGAAFVFSLLLVQYPFANFLMSDWAKNWFFGSHHFGYYVHPESYLRKGEFRILEGSALQFAWVMAQALIAAVLTTMAGLRAGSWIGRVQR
jgi:hypothetical protein